MSAPTTTQFKELIGKTLLSAVQTGDEQIRFTTTEGKSFLMYHPQDCCEHVSINDVCGELADLVGSPLIQAEETTNDEDHPPGVDLGYKPESFTWTFYRFATAKGQVVIRWLGESSGYYSEHVAFVEADTHRLLN